MSKFTLKPLFIKNLYAKREEPKIDELRKEFRNEIQNLIGNITANFEALTSRKVTLDGETEVDASIYIGSGGVLMGVHKYLQLMKQEQTNDETKMKALVKYQD